MPLQNLYDKCSCELLVVIKVANLQVKFYNISGVNPS
jgi:hypothetical protein